MRKFLSIAVFSMLTLSSMAGDIYVSSSSGSDSNPGTRKKPLKTLAALSKEQKSGSKIFLRRGDIFFESISDCTDCTIGAWGDGRKPVICGFRIQRDNDSWVREGPDIWKLDMADDASFYGFPHGKVSRRQLYGNVGCLYSVSDDRIVGNAVKLMKDLVKDGDFIVTEKFRKAELNEEDLRYLYIKSRKRPQAFCLSSGTNGISSFVRCRIEGIAVVGFGCHGIVGCHECVIKDCDIDVIGGSILLGNRNHLARYGNGIEFWIGSNPCNGNTVTGCQISRCYDTAATIQGPSSLKSHSADNHFRGNRIAYCRQGFEHWATTSDGPAVFENCDFTGNVLYCCGDNRFEGTPAHENDVALLAYHAPAEYFRIENNLIYGKNYRFNCGCTPGVRSNEVYILSTGCLLCCIENGGKTLIKADDAGKISYQAFFGDDSDIRILRPDTKEDRAARSSVMRKLKFNCPVPSRDELEKYR